MYFNNYLKVALAVPRVSVGHCMENAIEMKKIAEQYADASILLFPELSLTGYVLGDWFFNRELLDNASEALEFLVKSSNKQIWLVGTVIEYRGYLYNVACVIQNKKILGIVPKIHLAIGREFYETRLFASGFPFRDNPCVLSLFGQPVKMGSLLFKSSEFDVTFGIEICRDLWAPKSPHCDLFMKGAEIVFNLSASTYHLNKGAKRTLLCQSASMKGLGAYVFASTGMSETASDIAFSGHRIAYQLNECLLDEEELSFDSVASYVDIDLEKIKYSRYSDGWHHDESNLYKEVIYFDLEESKKYYLEHLPSLLPFVPKKDEEFASIIDITTASIYHRLKYIGIKDVVLGISGGLDSTLALLFCYETFKRYNLDLKGIHCYTMPALATGSDSLLRSKRLIESLGLKVNVIDISSQVLEQFVLIEHDENKLDTTYENVQARYRTLTLMNLANKLSAIVIGTGDMSEIALGWSTFNGDQMAMYNVNAGLPKTTIKAMIKYLTTKEPSTTSVLIEILNAKISPELISSSQSTEDTLGKYEINDFLLYHFFSCGASKKRIVFLLNLCFDLSEDEAVERYNYFFDRFNKNQYKRLASPEGIKIFPFSLSPRVDFRYPGDMK